MRITWIADSYHLHDGYGGYSRHLIRALARLGADVTPTVARQMDPLLMPGWMQRMAGLDYSHFNIVCAPPFYLKALPGRTWIITMTEGSRLPDGWAEHVNAKAERCIVPCEHNRRAFVESGVRVPVDVVPGGTCPASFPALPPNVRREGQPYVFLALADRAARKGWVEVYQAFYRAFGTPQDTPDVRLIIKTRLSGNTLINRMAGARRRDPRVSFWREDAGNMADVYALADCVAMPSRSEGWGMPHREAAMMGLPIITLRYSGLDDGNIEHWSLPVEGYRLEPVPPPHQSPHMAGEWARADIDELAGLMRECYDCPEEAAELGVDAARWLRENQTWDHSATLLADLIEEYV